MAENEFSAMKQFMQTVGLQIDDVAWTIGRTQTVSYSSKFGQVNFQSVALNYTVYINDAFFASYDTGIILFNMPASKYSLGNNYYESVYPSSRSFLQTGTSAPVSRVYVMEKLPMNDGNFIRIVVVPIIRMLNSTIFTGGEQINYFKFYLPILPSSSHPRHSQSITLRGENVSVRTQGDANSVRIEVSFPNENIGFDSDFFNFESLTVEVNVPSGSVIEFYTGEVKVSLGLHV